MLAEARQGNRDALGDLIAALWPELRRLAAAQMSRERTDHTWQPTALVNELYIEMIKAKKLDQGSAVRNDKNAFLGLAAHMMMRLLIHHARPLHRRVRKEAIPEDSSASEFAVENLSLVETLLSDLAAIHPELRTVVELKVFEGLSSEEMATRMGCSLRTVERRWTLAKHWLETNLR